MTIHTTAEEQLRDENAELRARLAEAEDTLRAIRAGEVDALVVETADGPNVFTLQGVDAVSNRFRGELLTQVSDALIAVDADQRVTYLNAAAERQYSVSASEVLGRHLSTIYTRQWPLAETEAAMWAGLREHGEWRGEIIHHTHDGRKIAVETNVTTLHDAFGALSGYVGVFRDITERMQADEALRESDARYRSLFENMLDGFAYCQMLLDEQGRPHDFVYLAVNDVFRKLTGLENVIGLRVTEVIPGISELHPEVFETYGRVASTGNPERFEIDFKPWGQRLSISVYCPVTGYFVAVFDDITERVRAEAEIRGNEELVRTIAENSTQAMVMMDDRGFVTYCNQVLLDMTGYNAEEIRSAPLHNLIHHHYPDGRLYPMEECPIDCALPEEFSVRAHEDLFFRKDGSSFEVLCAASPIFKDGKPVSTVIEVRDVTEQNAASRELIQTQTRLKLAMQVGGIGAWTLDIHTQNLRGDAILNNLFGFHANISPPPDQYFDRIHPDDRNRISQAVTDAIENGATYDQEYRIELADGGVRWARSYAQNLPSRYDTPTEFTGITYDVTDRKLREIDLVDRESHLRRVIDNMLGFVGVLDTDGIMLEVNQSALAASGIRREDVIGQKFWDCFWWSYDPAVIEQLRKAVERALAGETVRYDLDMRIMGDSRLTIDFMLVPVRDSDGNITQVIPSGIDITDRKAAESALVESQRKLQLGIDVAAFALAEVDYVAQTVDLSADAARLFGLGDAPTTVPRQRIHDVFHPEDRDRIHAAINNCLAPEGPDQIAIEFRIVPSDGTTRWLDVRKRIHFDNTVSPPKPIRSTMVARDITQERLLQTELIENRERLTLAMQSARMGAFQWEPDTDFAEWDEQWSAVIGVDKNAPQTGKTFFGLVHPEDIDSLLAVTPKNPETQSEYRTEFRIIRPDGQLRWLAASGMLLPRRNGHPARLVGLNWDITEQKESAERIRHGEERLRLALNAAQLSLWEWDVVNDQVSWAKELYDRQSMDRMIPIGGFDSFDNMVHVDDRKMVRAAINECLSEGKPYHCEFRMRRGDGSYRWVLSMAHLSIDGNNAPLRMVGVEMDITDRKESELSIRLSAERLAVAADAAGFGMLHIDLVLQAVTYSPEMKRIIGWQDDQSVSLKPGETSDFVHPDDRVRCAKHYEKAMLTGSSKSRSIDHRIVRTDGTTRWVRLQTKTLFSEHSGEATQIIGTLLDITQQRNFEEQLKAARDAAEAANQSKSAFVANMSHEIRTPMTAILGYADLIRDMIENPEAVSHLQTIRRNGAYLLEIINDILDLSKIEFGKLDIEMERIQPARLIEDVRSVMEVRATEGGLMLEVEYDGKLPKVIESDAKRLKQVLINLVGNAIKFTREGKVKIRVHYKSRAGQGGTTTSHQNASSVTERPMDTHDGGSALLDPLHRYGRLQFEIIDTGIGMTEVQRERLFKPFSQGDASVTRTFGGTGLGLAISQRLAEMLGGVITASSTEGVGSTFTVTICTGNVKDIELVDYAAELADQPKQVEPTAIEPVALDCHILVVDDRRDIRFLTKRLLTRAGATVAECEDGQIAVDYVTDCLNDSNCPDLILLDMQMPNMDGYEAARALRKLGYAKPIIALTADAMQGDMNACVKAGCNDYLSKPIDADLLVRKVSDLTTRKCI